jgi:tRNA nucleotidyltransferase/poly(A) polymerase
VDEGEQKAMSDYMFMLENHLSTDQNRVVAQVEAAASLANFSLFLAGGAMRDMLGGFQIRDLDFVVEGNAPKLSKTLTEKAGARVVSLDERRRTMELVFPGGVTAEIGMSRKEKYAKTGAQPQVTPATIQEDLRRRDFTVNAIALSLNRASRGLLLDPLNGLADLGRKELRTLYATAFYDDPSRLFRLIRLRLRLGYTVEERTQSQYANTREAKIETYIPHRALCEELKHIASEPNPAEVVRTLAEEGLLALMSPALTEAKLNLSGLAKLEKVRRLLPPEAGTAAANWGPFLHVLTELLSAKDKAALIKQIEMRKPEVDAWQKLPARAKKLETALRSARLKKPSQIYDVLSKAPADEIQFLLYQSTQRLVQDRIKNYFQKYLALAQEITDAEVEAKGVVPGTAKFQKLKAEMTAARLDGRTKKPAPPPPPSEPMTTGRRGVR